MKNTAIQWCDHTFNPWIGCTKVSSGCAHCYAESISKRFGRDVWGPGKERARTGRQYWKEPTAWDREASNTGERRRVFCASMADVFDEEAPDQWRNDLLALITRTPNLDWLLLTKRPKMAENWWADITFMPDNIWLGVSVENQEQADARIPILASIPAQVRFLSVEPMLGPIKLHHLDKIDWVIAGGESGPKCRPMLSWWACNLLGQAQAWNIAFFMKQMGGHPDKLSEMADFPQILRVREFPNRVQV